MEKNNIDVNLLICSFLEGNISEEDFSYLKSWTYENEENTAYARNELGTLFAAGVVADNTLFDKNAAIERFRRHAAGGTIAAEKHVSEKQKARTIPMWIKWAGVAAAVLLFLIPTITYYYGSKAVKDNFAQITMEAPEGSQLNLVLPDGSTVKLNSGSRIIYSQGYGIVNRDITLHGEGYFAVKHNSELQFTVNTRELAINDLGTEFNFRNYDDDSEACVQLFEGKITLDNKILNTSDIEVRPGEQIVINKRTGEMTKIKGSTDESTARKMTELAFDGMRISDIAKILSRSFGIKINVADSVADKRFYGYFDRKDDTIIKIMETIANTQQIKYRMEKGEIILY